MKEMDKGEVEEKRESKYIARLKTLVFSGNARLPENVSVKHVFGCLSVELEVDPVDFKIVDASCTLLPSLGEKILINALIGCEIEEGIKTAINEIESRFFSTTKRAIIAAVEDAHRKYVDYIKEKGVKRIIEY